VILIRGTGCEELLRSIEYRSPALGDGAGLGGEGPRLSRFLKNETIRCSDELLPTNHSDEPVQPGKDRSTHQRLDRAERATVLGEPFAIAL